MCSCPSYEDCVNTNINTLLSSMNTLEYKIYELKEVNSYLQSSRLEKIIADLYYSLGVLRNFYYLIQGIHQAQRCPYKVRDLKKFLEGLDDDQEIDINFLKALKS